MILFFYFFLTVPVVSVSLPFSKDVVSWSRAFGRSDARCLIDPICAFLRCDHVTHAAGTRAVAMMQRNVRP